MMPLWLKKLNHRKLSFLLAGIILFVSALIFSASLIFTIMSSQLGAEYYSQEGAPNLFYLGNNKEITDTIQNTASDTVTVLGSLDGVQLTEAIQWGNENLTGTLSVSPVQDYTKIPWEITPKKGDLTDTGPRPGEIWIPQIWADQKDIQVDDMLILQGNIPFRVSTLYTSYLNSSSGNTQFQLYINPEGMPLLPDLPPYTITPLYVTGNLKEAQALMVPALSNYSGLKILESHDLLDGLTTPATISGGIGLLSAILVFIVAVVAIRFMLRAHLMKDYRSIGIYKSQGFSNSRIRSFYLNCYAVVGGISLLLGVAAGPPAAAALISNLVMKYVDTFIFPPFVFLLAALSFLLLFVVLNLNVFLATRPIRKITPINAMRIGMTSTRAKFKRSLIPNASSPLAMAINDIAKHKGYSVMIVLILCVSFYLVAFSLSSWITVNNIGTDTDIWFSVPKSDVFVTGRIDDKLIDRLQSDPRVQKLIISEEFHKTTIALDEIYNYSTQINSFIYNDFSTLPYGKGRAPRAANEIAVNTRLLRELGLQVGDHLSLSLMGTEKDVFLITGEYESMTNGGASLQIPADSLPLHAIEFVPSILMIHLQENTSPQPLIDALNQEYEGIKTTKNLFLIDAAKDSQKLVSPVALVLIIVFSAFSLLNITNLILQNHADNRRQYGILKALGFSTGYISARNGWRIFLLSILAAAAALLLHILVSPKIFAIAIMDALILSIPQILCMLGSLLAIIMALTFIFCLPIRKIMPQELMEE